MLVGGCELLTHEAISSFLTDAHVHLLAMHYAVPEGAAAALGATKRRAAEILDCVADTGCLFDAGIIHHHLASLVATARLVCGATSEEEEEAGLRGAVAAACATLCPLLAEFPPFWAAVVSDEGVAGLWVSLEGARRAAGEMGPEVRERMRWVVEAYEV
ncbi:hypothetical protein Daus18300_007146 [Diaporthe australafricana]|uniref:Uncharacterized protein n=1 Tax=Diaporthe australafricana TaxID=127596 RepID=A0ABR3WPB0_9PEZI